MNGILLVNKEIDLTSFFCVSKIKRNFNIKKVGHCGTLDPLATGLLILVLGKSTKLSQLITNFSKVYETELLLGKETDSQDITGKILQEKSFSHINKEKIQEELLKLKGKQKQIPPMFSAIKKNGRKLYEFARKGINIDRPPRDIEIKELTIDNIDIPKVSFTTHVSKGTYIRTICHDLGLKLDCVACMNQLIRHQIGPFKLKDSKTLSEYLKMNDDELSKHIISPEKIKNLLEYA